LLYGLYAYDSAAATKCNACANALTITSGWCNYFGLSSATAIATAPVGTAAAATPYAFYTGFSGATTGSVGTTGY